MNLQLKTYNKQLSRAFTILEMLVVFGIFAVIFAVTLPFTIETYRHHILSSETKNIVSVLRRAQGYSLTNSLESSFGVSLQGTQSVIFRGVNYANRIQSYDEIYPISGTVTVTGPSEIIFEQVSGRPNTSATITLVSEAKTQTVTVNAQGVIDW